MDLQLAVDVSVNFEDYRSVKIIGENADKDDRSRSTKWQLERVSDDKVVVDDFADFMQNISQKPWNHGIHWDDSQLATHVHAV